MDAGRMSAAVDALRAARGGPAAPAAELDRLSIELRDVSVAYDRRLALRGLSARVPGGGWLALIGPNGAGKTTLLRAIAGLVPLSGEVRLGEMPVSALSRRRVAQLVAYVPQRPQIPGAMLVSDYVLLGRTPYIPYLGTERRRDLAAVARAIERLELDALAERPLGSLSGGEVQRAVLARALAQEAPILLLDEPTAALDVGHQQQLLELIDELRLERGLTVVSAMHDLTLAGQFAAELLLLAAGRVVAAGSARDVLTEATIGRHYGASVRVVEDPEGRLAVLATRTNGRAGTRVGRRPTVEPRGR
jgi:iron complex transport system ATP-binding protein